MKTFPTKTRRIPGLVLGAVLLIPAVAFAQGPTACRAQIWTEGNEVVAEMAHLKTGIPAEAFSAAVEEFANRLEPLFPEMSPAMAAEVETFVLGLRDLDLANPIHSVRLANSFSALLLTSASSRSTQQLLDALLETFRSADRTFPFTLEQKFRSLPAAAQRCRA